MGIVKPQRDILKMIMKPGHYGNMGLPYYEMKDHGVNNYCCGGGSGFAIMQSMSFPQWRNNIAHRKKLEQILEAFGPEVMENTDVPKYICAPCSNCKGAMRDIIEHYRLDRFNVHYGGLVELIVNAMTKYSLLIWNSCVTNNLNWSFFQTVALFSNGLLAYHSYATSTQILKSRLALLKKNLAFLGIRF